MLHGISKAFKIERKGERFESDTEQIAAAFKSLLCVISWSWVTANSDIISTYPHPVISFSSIRHFVRVLSRTRTLSKGEAKFMEV